MEGYMSIEFQALLGVVGVLFLLLPVQGALVPLTHGLKWGLGPRDEARDPSVMQGRLRRIVANHLEGMAMFTPLIFIAHLAEISTPLTQWGAEIYLAGRIAFAAVYIFGVPGLRSAVWGVSMAGLLMVAFAIVQNGF
jgi:uncharacterized MAPEG superfamily protein